ncbi:hypothetical protein [Nocardia sp. NPDC050406]|uniref:hypothetical protein n=1 Tax=Nocardia sp. NPDC050406 TaxID=3364318 RepID=UPI0037AB4CF2
MISFLAALLTVALFGWLVYHFAPAPGEHWDRMLTRYRPHSPMSEWSLADYDGQRQHADLAAIRAHRDAEALRERAAVAEVRAAVAPKRVVVDTDSPIVEAECVGCGGPAVQS